MSKFRGHPLWKVPTRCLFVKCNVEVVGSFAIRNHWIFPWSNNQGELNDLDDDPEDFFIPEVEIDIDFEDEKNFPDTHSSRGWHAC